MTHPTVSTDTGPIAVIRPRVSRADITGNELAWIGFLREISHWSDPASGLRAVQQLRLALGDGGRQGGQGDAPKTSPGATPP